MDRTAQELIINQLVDKIDEFDEDLIIKLQDSISEALSDENKEDKFIKLYETAQNKLDNLISNQYGCPYDIWEFFWERLYEKNGLIHKAYKLVPFNTDIIDSSYEDEVHQIMLNWKSKVDELKSYKKQEKYFDEL